MVLLMADERFTIEWVDDWQVDHVKEYDYYRDGEGPSTCEGCIIRSSVTGEIVDSWWCIDDADDEYRRQLEQDMIADIVDEWVHAIV